MPSKNNSNKKKKDNDEDLKQEGNLKLQAVLLADAVFGSRVTSREDYQSLGLRPWSSDASTSSQILCPINNVPLVDYILDFLASNGVEQVIVVIGSCAGSDDALENYLTKTTTTNGNNNTNNNTNHHGLELLFLKDTSLMNAGDALRELYKRNWIRASKQALPFLLVSGDVVANLDLREAMRAHKERNSNDSAAAMTIVLKPVQTTSNNHARQSNNPPSIVPRVSDLVVGLVGASCKTVATADAQGGDKGKKQKENNSGGDGDSEPRDYRVMYYDNGGKGGTTLPCTFLTQSQSKSASSNSSSNGGGVENGIGGLEVRHDLLDTGIAICSPDVLGRLEDEFDYLDLAHDFVANSVAEEEDGLQTRIYAHVLEDVVATGGSGVRSTGCNRNYAARAVDFQTYHAISRDLLQRWAYPTVPDHMLLSVSRASSQRDNTAQRRYRLVKGGGAASDHQKKKQQRATASGGSNAPKRAPRSPEHSSSTSSNNNNNNDCTGAPKTRTNNFDNNNNQYQYKEVLNPTKVGRTSIVVGPGMMGSHGTVGEGCTIVRCVLGDSVVVGNNARLVDCHLMDGVVVGEGANLESCVVARNAVVRKNAVLNTGCFVGENCVIGEAFEVGAFSRVTLAEEDDDDDWGDDGDGYSDSSDDESDGGDGAGKPPTTTDGGDTDHDVVGPDGKGRLWKPPLDQDGFSDDDEEENGGDNNNGATYFETLVQLQSMGGDPSSYYRREERRLLAQEEKDHEDDGFSDREDDEDEMAETLAFSEFTGGTVTFGNDDGDGYDYDDLNYSGGPVGPSTDEVIGRQKGIDVIKEMTEICMEFDDECHPIENLAIELNSFKFSQNATYGDCATACLLSLLRKMEVSPSMTDGRLVSLLKAKLDKFWTGILQKLCRGVTEEVAIVKALEHAATVDQQQQQAQQLDAEATDALQKSTEIAQKLRSGMAFRFVLQTLHDQEVLSEEAILVWAGEHRESEESASVDDPKQAVFRMQSVQDFLEWLEDESDDDDSDSGSGSDDEDSD